MEISKKVLLDFRSSGGVAYSKRIRTLKNL